MISGLQWMSPRLVLVIILVASVIAWTPPTSPSQTPLAAPASAALLSACHSSQLVLATKGCGVGASPSAPSAAPTPGWTNITSGSGPGPRYGASMAYDHFDGYVLLFGGDRLVSGAPQSENDTWRYSNATWTNITSTVGPAPTPRGFATLVDDAFDGYMVLIGGVDASGTNAHCNANCNDTWSFVHGRWSQVPPQYPFGTRYINTGSLTAAYDPAAGYVVVQSVGGTAPTSGTTYSYRGGNYTDLSFNSSSNQTGLSPNFFATTLTYDPTLEGLVLFGGETTFSNQVYQPTNITWLFSNGTWSNLTASLGPGPSPRAGAAADFDNASDGLIVFGGDLAVYPPNGPDVGGTWELAGGRWTNLTSGSAPPSVAAAALVWDPEYNVSFLYGGLQGQTTFNTTYEWSASPFMSGLVADATPNPVDVNATASFHSSLLGGTPPFRYSWTFGDGGASAMAAPSHSYQNAGTYVVELTLVDGAAQVINASFVLEVRGVGIQPQAAPNPTDVGVDTLFTSGIVGGAGIDSFTWSFGDGTYGHGQTITHAYAHPGAYPVQVWVNDSGGSDLTGNLSVTVNPALSIIGVVAAPTNPNLGQLVNFSASSAGGSPPIVYSWRFGDGGLGGNLENISHVFTTNGPFSAEVTVVDAAGASVSRTTNLTVELNLTVSAKWRAGAAPLLENFTSRVDGGAPDYSYSWAFGDGMASQFADPSHVFSQPGVYNPTLTVHDSSGEVATASWEVYVTPAASDFAVELSASPSEVQSEQPTVVTALVSGGSGGFEFTWSLTGNGSCSPVTIVSERCVSGSNGTLRIALSILDGLGHQVSGVADVTVGASAAGRADQKITLLSAISAVSWIAIVGSGAGAIGIASWALGRRRHYGQSLAVANPTYHILDVSTPIRSGTSDASPAAAGAQPPSGVQPSSNRGPFDDMI